MEYFSRGSDFFSMWPVLSGFFPAGSEAGGLCHDLRGLLQEKTQECERQRKGRMY